MKKCVTNCSTGAMRPPSFPGGKFIGQAAVREHSAKRRPDRAHLFEQGLKDQILLDKLRNLITGSALVTDDDVRREFEKQNTKVKFDYAVLRKDDLLKQIKPSEAELKAFYERNKATYNNSIPEKRKVQYVVLDTAKIEAGVSVSRETIYRPTTISIATSTACPSRSM